MGCSSCSSTPATQTYSSGCAASSSDAPRRVSNPPTVPVSFSWVARMRTTTSGKLVVSDNEELQNLDSAVDGPIRFDAATGTAYVGCDSVTNVQDNYACSEAVFGFPVYGADPGCRDLGANPDRQLAVVRPTNSQYGTLYGHKKTCPAGSGLKAEITPVEIVPTTFPIPPTEGIKYLAYRKVSAGDDCTPATIEWFEGLGVPNVDEPNLQSTNGGGDALLAADDGTTGFAIWEKSGGVWTLKRVENAALPELVKGPTNSGAGSIDYLDAPIQIYSQYKIVAGVSIDYGQSFYPDPGTPTIGPIISETVLVDLTNKIKYSEYAKGVLLNVVLKGGTDANSTGDVIIAVDGMEYSRILGSFYAFGSNTNQVCVKIPANKKISISLIIQPNLGDSQWHSMLGAVYLQGFTY